MYDKYQLKHKKDMLNSLHDKLTSGKITEFSKLEIQELLFCVKMEIGRVLNVNQAT